MEENKTNKLSERLCFVHFMKNKAHHFGIKINPYEVMFNTEPRTGLLKNLLSKSILKKLEEQETENANAKILNTSYLF